MTKGLYLFCKVIEEEGIATDIEFNSCEVCDDDTQPIDSFVAEQGGMEVLRYRLNDDASHLYGFEGVICLSDPDAKGPEVVFREHKVRQRFVLAAMRDNEPVPVANMFIDFIRAWFMNNQHLWKVLYHGAKCEGNEGTAAALH